MRPFALTPPSSSGAKAAALDPKTIESVWRGHVPTCTRCAAVDLDRTATVAGACLQGSQMIKALVEKRRAPELAKKRKARALAAWWAQGGTTRTSKKAAAKAMRYRE